MNDMSEGEQAKFHEWMLVLASVAFEIGHIDQRWSATQSQCESLRGYFSAGLTPDQGEQALFAVRH